MIKDLNINGIIHCKYIIDKETLYLKCLVNFFKKDLSSSEHICIELIKIIEEQKFKMVAYLPE